MLIGVQISKARNLNGRWEQKGRDDCFACPAFLLGCEACASNNIDHTLASKHHGTLVRRRCWINYMNQYQVRQANKANLLKFLVPIQINKVNIANLSNITLVELDYYLSIQTRKKCKLLNLSITKVWITP
jgi:hypothetical protein